jgi:haloacid dehalogenase-like hydrolase
MRDDGVLVVDLDGTVVRRNTFPLYVRLQMVEGLRRHDVGLVVRLAALVAMRELRLIGHRTFKTKIVGLSERLGGDPCRDWARDLLARYANPEVLALVRGWAGPKVLASAAPEGCVRAFAELLAVEDCIGSVVWGGRLINNEGETKLDRLAASGYREIEAAISDDPRADAPLLRAARQRYVVAPAGTVSRLAPGPALRPVAEAS